MNENYYPVDFEAQYEETSEKMIQISKKYKDLILNSNPDPIQKIQETLQSILFEIQQHDLLFRKQSIYSQFAPGQLMAERRKQPPEMCPECGQELKKTTQCEFCAQLFCKKCCSRSRVIPFVSKQSRLCCQQCHYKFVKLFDNKNFYEEKEKLVNVINFTRNKTNKVLEKINSKKQEVQAVKNERRNERIKEKNMEKKIQEEEKKVKQLQEQFRAIIANKAKKIIEAQKRREEQLEEEKRKVRKAQEERLRKQQEEKAQKQAKQAKQAQQRRKAELNNVKSKQSESSKKSSHKEPSQKQKSQRSSFRANKSVQGVKQKSQQPQEKQKQPLKPTEKSKRSKSSFRSNHQINQTPKHVAFQSQIKKQQLVDTAATSSKKNKSRRQSEDVSVSSNKDEASLDSNLALKPSQSAKKSSEQENDEKKSNTNKLSEEPEDALERSLSRMLKLHKENKNKDDDSKSLVSGMSKASKNIIDMTVNELLGLRIPTMTNRTSSKGKIPLEEEEKNDEDAVSSSEHLTANEEKVSPVSPLSSRERSSIQIQNINEPEEKPKDEIIRDRNQIIQRNSTLISSTNSQSKRLEPAEYEPRKCECVIM